MSLPNNKQSKSPFRADALHYYQQSQQQTTFPRFVRPRSRLYLWLLLGLLLLGSTVIWLAQLPVYASGTVVVTNWPGGAGTQDIILVAFLPAEHLEGLHPGQRMLIQTNQAAERVVVTVSKVEPAIVSADAVHERFGLHAQAISYPTVIAVAPLAPQFRSLPRPMLLGSSYPVEVEIGSRRLISFLPVVGPFFSK